MCEYYIGSLTAEEGYTPDLYDQHADWSIVFDDDDNVTSIVQFDWDNSQWAMMINRAPWAPLPY